MVKEQSANLMVSANAVNGNKGGLGSAYLRSVINDFNVQKRTELTMHGGPKQLQGLEIVPLYRYNPTLKYEVYMVPALMVMILAMICGFLPALNIVGEKESGTIEQINVTPIKKSTFILSKLIPYWIIGFFVLTISCDVDRLAFLGIDTQGKCAHYLLFCHFVYCGIFWIWTRYLQLCSDHSAGNVYDVLFCAHFYFSKRFIYTGGEHATMGTAYQ